MEGMSIGEEIVGGCTIGVSDSVTEGMFDMEIIGDGNADGCAVGSSDGDGVTI